MAATAATRTTLALIIKLCLRFTEGAREPSIAAETVSCNEYKSYRLQGRLCLEHYCQSILYLANDINSCLCGDDIHLHIVGEEEPDG